jgi:hypothetical protein
MKREKQNTQLIDATNALRETYRMLYLSTAVFTLRRLIYLKLVSIIHSKIAKLTHAGGEEN